MTGHDDRTAANGNADRHARASHRHRVRDGRRAGAACGCVRSGVRRSAPSFRVRFRSSTEPLMRQQGQACDVEHTRWVMRFARIKMNGGGLFGHINAPINPQRALEKIRHSVEAPPQLVLSVPSPLDLHAHSTCSPSLGGQRPPRRHPRVARILAVSSPCLPPTRQPRAAAPHGTPRVSRRGAARNTRGICEGQTGVGRRAAR